MSLYLRHRHLSGLFRACTTAAIALDPKAPLPALEKSRVALSQLRSETNPERILEICRAAALSPGNSIERAALTTAVLNLKKSNNFSYVQTYINELRSTRPDLRNEEFDALAIVLFGLGNMLNHAFEVFKDVHKSKKCGSVRCLNSLMLACILNKDYEQLKRVYVEFLEEYNVEPDVHTFNKMIRGFRKSGETNSSYSILAEMERRSVNPTADTFAEMLKGFYHEGKHDEVQKVLNMMKDQYRINSSVSIYNTRIKILCTLKRAKEAKLLFDELKTSKLKPNVITYGALILGFCEENDLEEAKNLFEEMSKKGMNPKTGLYSSLGRLLCLEGEFGSATRVCQQAIKKGRVPYFSTMAALVRGLTSQGKTEEAKELIAEFKEKAPRKAEMWETLEARLSGA